jgi:MOSC domain-containing protein
MTVTEVWRYPVKTMAGGNRQRLRMGPLGIDGDRVVHVEDAQCRVITSRSHPQFLGHKGSLDTDGTPLVDGWPWKSQEVSAEIVDIAAWHKVGAL